MMAVLLNGANVLVQYVAVPVQYAPTEKVDSCVDTSDLLGSVSRECQTEGLRKAIVLDPKLHALISKINYQYPSLQCRVLQYGKYGEEKAVEISRIKADLPPQRNGPMSVTCLTVLPDGAATFNVAGECLISSSIEGPNGTLDDDKVGDLLQKLSDSHVFCSGISKDELKRECSAIRYDSKTIETKLYPFERYIARRCQKWFSLRKNASQDERHFAVAGDSRCPECNRVYSNLRVANRHQILKLSQKSKRIQASSTYPITLLSPVGKRKRSDNIIREKKRQKKQLTTVTQKWTKFVEVELQDAQSRELSKFVRDVDTETLDAALAEVEPDGEGTVESLKEVFLLDQRRNGKNFK
jgi:hypothetical protein